MARYETDEQKRLMARVQKMLNLANDAGATEGERDNAMRMAHALLAKHNLDLAQCMQQGGSGAEAANAAEPRIEHTAVFGGWPWALQVNRQVAELFFCTYLVGRGRSANSVRHYFIGRTSNALTASYVAEFVVRSVYKEACREMRIRGEGMAYVRSFCWGAYEAVRKRVGALRAAATQESASSATPGTALVLASHYDTEREANARFVAERYGANLVPRKGGRSGGTMQSEAYASGHSYGGTVSLSAQVK